MQSSISRDPGESSRSLEAAAHAFRKFARHCHGESPLYEQLSQGIAADPGLLALAAQAQPGQPVANMLFAAVHYLLLSDARHPLAAFYPDCGGHIRSQADPLPVFRDFCTHYAEPIAALLRQRRTQTNEVGRCAYLLPAFTTASRLFDGRPLALIEIGASAGLNLRWDSYRYDYGAGRRFGQATAAVCITSEIRGARLPPLPLRMPLVSWRQGIDVHPVDLQDAEARRWLHALVWPEQLERAALLQQAMEAARCDPPSLLAGDALSLLPDLLVQAPPESLLCVYHTHVVYQFSAAQRAQLRQQIAAAGARRDLCYFATEGVGTADPRLELQLFRAGQSEERLLAVCHHHGRWLAWADHQTAQVSAE